MDAIERRLETFAIADPVEDESDIGHFVNPTLQALFDDLMASGLRSELEALVVGGTIEETDILDIQQAIERADNEAIIATYERLLCGSRNHLRAFVRQIESQGQKYTPALMSQDEFRAIVDSPMKRGCGAGNKGKGKEKNNRNNGKRRG